MKKKLPLVLLSILLIGFVIGAGGLLLPKNREAVLDNTQTTALEKIGLTDLEISPLICNQIYCRATIYKQDAINTEITFERYYLDKNNNTILFTDEELSSILNERIQSRLQTIADAEVSEEGNIDEIKDGGGSLTIKDSGGTIIGGGGIRG